MSGNRSDASGPRLPSSERLRRHIEEVRRVNPDFDLIPIDFWAPGIIDLLTNLRQQSGRLRKIAGEIDQYTLCYWRGRDLPTEMEVIETSTGRRLIQDGTDNTRLLDALLVRLTDND